MASPAVPTVVTPQERDRIQARTLRVVVLSQVLGGAGLAAGATVGALLAEEMLGSQGLAGIPVAVVTLGSALAAYLVGRVTQSSGRRLGLGAGFAIGGLGAAGVVLAAVLGQVWLLFVALFVYGAGTASNLQARYAGTDLAAPHRRATAASVALVSTTVGAVAGPNLVEPLGHLADAWGIPPLAGPFLLASVAYLAAGATLLVLLRPDPFLLARSLTGTAADPDPTHGEPAMVRGEPLTTHDEPAASQGIPPVRTTAWVGAGVMVMTQIVMVAIMTMTPVHMRAHDHALGAVGLVISLHIAAMYLPSLVTGALIDKVGRLPMAAAAGVTLLLAGVVAALAPGESMGWIVLALVLLGLGWNLGLISGTALVVDGTVPANRARTQGTIDVLIALAGAAGGAFSGVVVAMTSFAGLSYLGAAVAFAVVPLLWLAVRDRAA
ncbi:Major Facilitator Superfamily transporter [Kytococcus sedentarius DSM 20547]|uniref:Major Facilitator Superfamily transporter n=1 Tax=Kytococcus sedentarius (strain ATCC 14392 / DSM 20547 / JCM 11482 / CCUG 33030 / NBRC 15357 / NCTC 11040 / CCM 314 / 541) TaxID=478801 RepID=C7NHV0_KYTSD|nr:Major Facilitator Superfamily transporter [Kytococcus sedentarius DSM 20547]